MHRYVSTANENCQLCDRPVHLLDYYADIEPDRDYDIYSMSDDIQMCSKPKSPDHKNNARKIMILFYINYIFNYLFVNI